MVQVKGGRTQLLAEIFIITSRIPLEGQYPNVTAQCVDNRDQLTNRITTVVHLDGSKGKNRSAACIGKVQGVWDLLFPVTPPEEEVPDDEEDFDLDFLDDIPEDDQFWTDDGLDAEVTPHPPNTPPPEIPVHLEAVSRLDTDTLHDLVALEHDAKRHRVS